MILKKQTWFDNLVGAETLPVPRVMRHCHATIFRDLEEWLWGQVELVDSPSSVIIKHDPIVRDIHGGAPIHVPTSQSLGGLRKRALTKVERYSSISQWDTCETEHNYQSIVLQSSINALKNYCPFHHLSVSTRNQTMSWFGDRLPDISPLFDI